MPKKLHIDVETYSPVDIKKSGAYKYTQSLDFEILMIAYAFDEGPVIMVDLASGEGMPIDFVAALVDPNIQKWAHNATFERLCFEAYGYKVPIDQWYCSAIKAAYCGLPLHLDGVSKALHLEEKGKLATGRALIRYFCVPCKPTKTNGGRTRNLPHHDPDKWEEFKRYCINDVEAERETERILSGYEIPEIERRYYILDQEINDRGVLLDVDMAIKALTINDTYTGMILEELKEITGVDNPNSGAQLKAWLSDALGKEIKSLAKDTIPALLEETEDATVEKVIDLRSKSSLTSIKKYEAMVNCACDDNRAHGLVQFYGASRTGRWAGRLVQMHNLKQNHLDDLDFDRKLLKSGDFDMISMMYDDVSDWLSQLIRTTFIAKDGHTFLVADFSAIEARVIAWFAEEQWRIDLFNKGGDIYIQSYAQMMSVDPSEVGDDERKKGKVAELACIAEGQLVTTNKGLIPIEQITTDHLVYDGTRFVKHDGLVYKGIKKTITYEGLTATEDHLVWVEGSQEPIHFGEAASRDAHLKIVAPRFVIESEKGYNKVYDILNAGPNNRFTVSGVLVHNCGYQGSVGALKQMGGDKIGLSESEMGEIVKKWRKNNRRIVHMWYDLEKGALKAFHLRSKVNTGYKGVCFDYDGTALTMELPSGRKLFYWKPQLNKKVINGREKESLRYWGKNQTTGQWALLDTYGGKLVENLVQATARDLLAHAMDGADKKEHELVMHVHDEIVVETPEEDTENKLSKLCDLMAELPWWAEGLPHKAVGYVTKYYKKD